MTRIKNIILIFTVLSIVLSASLSLVSVGADEPDDEMKEPTVIEKEPPSFELHTRETYGGIVYDVEEDGTMVANAGNTSAYYTFGEVTVEDGKLRFMGQQNEKTLLFERVRLARNNTDNAISFAEHSCVVVVFDFQAIGTFANITMAPVLRSDTGTNFGEMNLNPFKFTPYVNDGTKTVTVVFEVMEETDELNYYIFFDGMSETMVKGCKNASEYYFSGFDIGFTISPSLLSVGYELGNVSVFVKKNG